MNTSLLQCHREASASSLESNLSDKGKSLLQALRTIGAICAIAMLIVCFQSSSFAQTPGEQEYTVLGVSVEGNESGSAETIIAQSGIRKGDKVTIPSDEVRRAITRLWQQNIFSDVNIEATKIIPQDGGTLGVYLTIKVKEFRHCDSVIIDGYKHLSLSDIEKTFTFYKNDFLRPWEVANIKEKIKAAYVKEGYQYADITSEVKPVNDGTGKVHLYLHINEGTEVTIRHIDFTGNTNVSSSDLRGAMDDTHEKPHFPSFKAIFHSGTFDEKKLADDKQKILAFYRTKGYRDAAILGDSIWVTDKEDLNILINVYEGPQYYLRNISIIGNEVFSEAEIRTNLGFKKGDVYNVEKFQLNLKGPTQDFIDVGSLYYDRGYIVNIEPVESIVPKKEGDTGPDSLDIAIHINEGKRHYLRNIDIAGNTKTKDYVIRRELYTRPGDPFSRSAIIRSLRQLAQLNYFNQEKLVPDVKPVADATEFDVTYNVEEKSSDTFNASLGYGGSLGLTGSIGVSFNNFDIADPLHGGAGQIASVSAEFGQLNYRTLSISFTEPWLWQEPTALGFSIFNQQSNIYYSIVRTGATISIGRRFRVPDDFFRGDWTLLGQHSDITSGGGIYTPGIHDEISLQQVISRNSTDDPLFPAGGSDLSFLTKIAYLPTKSIPPNEPANYYKVGFTLKFYTTLAQFNPTNKLVLATVADVGQLGGISGAPFVPPQERFTMGGSGLATGFYTVPLRGYNDASIGIQTAPGSTYSQGGLFYNRYVAELRFQISREPIPIFVEAFAEAGNVWADFSNSDPFSLKRAAGFGARVQVPAVGLIGIDLGYGFDSNVPFGPVSGWHTHFQFGRFF
ncbi:MAG: outer membrane protein assembly factor BamA [Bacteroidota bacterium]|nr:outer membrane protein assembly factor BamA [Bacteroidota bacterium]MDP4235035.1 outer membrane protein assembly factor BamA [Bacteroidota bacterium]